MSGSTKDSYIWEKTMRSYFTRLIACAVEVSQRRYHIHMSFYYFFDLHYSRGVCVFLFYTKTPEGTFCFFCFGVVGMEQRPTRQRV